MCPWRIRRESNSWKSIVPCSTAIPGNRVYSRSTSISSGQKESDEGFVIGALRSGRKDERVFPPS